MNQQKIVNLQPGTLSWDAVNKSQLDLKADQATTYTKIESDALYLNLAGGTITGPIYQNTSASELNQLATKQYVLDNAGSGGGG
jgi:hypothetical protein